MDETANAFAYRCLPLTIANAHGWEMLCPFAFEATWTGEVGISGVQLTLPDEAALPKHSRLVTSHFGSGILTFTPEIIVRTPPGYDTWITGPSNSFKDGIQAMAAAIETDWMPYSFAVSWMFTRPNTTIRFEEGEPFCQFFPVKRGVVAACEPRLERLADHPGLNEAYHWALSRRGLDSILYDEEKEQFQGWYKRGEMPNKGPGGIADHRAVLKPRPFKRPG